MQNTYYISKSQIPKELYGRETLEDKSEDLRIPFYFFGFKEKMEGLRRDINRLLPVFTTFFHSSFTKLVLKDKKAIPEYDLLKKLAKQYDPLASNFRKMLKIFPKWDKQRRNYSQKVSTYLICFISVLICLIWNLIFPTSISTILVLGLFVYAGLRFIDYNVEQRKKNIDPVTDRIEEYTRAAFTISQPFGYYSNSKEHQKRQYIRIQLEPNSKVPFLTQARNQWANR